MNLVHWTVVLTSRGGFEVDRFYTDENDLKRHISTVLDKYDGVCFPEAYGPGKHYKTLTVQYLLHILQMSNYPLWTPFCHNYSKQ